MVFYLQQIVRRPVREKGLEDWEVYDEITTTGKGRKRTSKDNPSNMEVRFNFDLFLFHLFIHFSFFACLFPLEFD